MLLRNTHRNLLVVLLFMLVFDFWEAGVHLFGPANVFSSPGLARVNDIRPLYWGLAFGTAGVLLAAGMWRTTTFAIARVGIAVGLLTCTVRVIMLAEIGQINFTGIPTWLLAAGTHLSCVMEPPSNPASL